MQPTSPLTRLRRLRGLTVAELSRAARLSEAEVRLLEEGRGAETALERLLDFYNLDVEPFFDGRLEHHARDSQATVFLFHGAYQEFNLNDLAVMEPALQAARRFSLSKNEVVEQRLAMDPVPVSGSNRAAAAKQGYRLARALRERLGNSTEPFGDMGDLLRDELGIHLSVAPLQSKDLRAAAILDNNRAAAAVILNQHDEHRQRNPLLARVYLAHEICHLLFDHSGPGKVQIVLDDSIDRPTNQVALREKRARGFSAEFLLPREGLFDLLGEPSGVLGREQAQNLIQTARRHFHTPWQIAVNHLHNLGYFDRSMRRELEHNVQHLDVEEHHHTRLPAPGEDSETPEDQLLQTARAAWDEARRGLQALDQQRSEEAELVCLEARKLIESDRGRAVARLLVRWVDEALLRSDFGRVVCLLARLNTDQLPPKALTGVLMITRDARSELGESREDFFYRIKGSLRKTHGWANTRIETMVKRLH